VRCFMVNCRRAMPGNGILRADRTAGGHHAPGCVEWCSPWLQRTRTPDATELAEVIEHVRRLAIQRRILSHGAAS
jgi:hypothetical protein